MEHADILDMMIRDSYLPNLKELEELWITMGLSKEEIDVRMHTVRTKISDVTTEMVECDRDNKMKIEEVCNNLKKEIRVLWRKLKLSGEPEQVPSGLTLLEMQKKLKLSLVSLKARRKEIMEEFRSLIDEERSLAAKLGLESIYIDEDSIPEREEIQRVEENMIRMVRVKEERETHMFTLKEETVLLLEMLGMDLNATTLSSVLDGEDFFDSLRLSDLRSVQHTMQELKITLDQRMLEVTTLMKDISSLYVRLGMTSNEQCPLSTGQVCGVEELIKEDNLVQLKEEKTKLEKLKRTNMIVIIKNAKTELSVLWEKSLVGNNEQSQFLAGLEGESDETLAAVEYEICRLRKYFVQHKDTLLKIVVYLELCDLAEDLKERMMDPNRLFKSRGKALVQEEQDRRKVNMIPRKKEELLAIAEHKGNIMVFDEALSTLVEDHAHIYEDLFPPPSTRSLKNQSNSLSSTRSGKSFSTTVVSLRGNKTASPRSTKKLGKYHTSPAARKVRTARTTPLSAQPPSPARRQAKARLAGVSPLARPAKMIRANTTLGTGRATNTTVSRRVQMPDLVPDIRVHDGTVNESVFSDNVPYNSTVLCNESAIFSGNSMVPDITMDMENTVVLSGFIDKMVAARDLAVAQDRMRVDYGERNMRNDTCTGGSKIPRQAQNVATKLSSTNSRKLRRSNSCSEIVLASKKIQGGLRPRLGSKPDGKENLASIRESAANTRGSTGTRPELVRSNSCLTASGSKRGMSGTARLSRAGSSNNIVLR